MNMTLLRQVAESDGVYGTLTSEDNAFSCVTLEHAYDSGLGNGTYSPKLPNGTYTCQRGQHQLESMTTPFTTFQIMNVLGHTNILLHFGNYNKDSNGCVLLGRRIVPNPSASGENMITSSRNTFNAFMDLQEDVDQFTLTVKDQV